MYTPFAYAINKTPYVILYWFSVKITLCMYILCDQALGLTHTCSKNRRFSLSDVCECVGDKLKYCRCATNLEGFNKQRDFRHIG